MKKLLCLLLALLLCPAALAEETALLPVTLLAQEAATLPLEAALTAAKAAVGTIPEKSMIRAELAEMSDGTQLWFVTIFDTATFTDAWCVTVDASTGEVASLEAAQEGFFSEAYAVWTAQKGVHALWSLMDKQLYDALYTMSPSYGLPLESDLSDAAALNVALSALGLTSAEGYEVGYGYLMGGEGYNGVWEITLVQDGAIVYQVNLDAVNGEIYYMHPDEAVNG